MSATASQPLMRPTQGITGYNTTNGEGASSPGGETGGTGQDHWHGEREKQLGISLRGV